MKRCPLVLSETENTALDKLVSKLELHKFDPKQSLTLIFKMLDIEFSVPRSHKDSALRNKYLIEAITAILKIHYTYDTALAMIAQLGENLLLEDEPSDTKTEIDTAGPQYIT